MSRPNRRDIVDPDNVGVYHCYSRCVQRAYLCGTDRETGQCYEHRKEWIEARQELLVSVYAMELLGYAILDNHMHHVVRTRPDVARGWTDEEVVRRWYRLHPQKNEKREVIELTQEHLEGLLRDKARVAEWRRRLASLSWYMKDLKENIAKRANREAGTTGHFFDARFSSPQLADVLTLLLCLLYVELNPIRAGKANTPEASRYTSIWRRIQARQVRLHLGTMAADTACAAPDAALTPICETGESDNRAAPQYRVSDLGFLPMTTDQYLDLVDWYGRQEREDKRGAIPRHLAPILERLSDNTEYWDDPGANYERRWRGASRRIECVLNRCETIAP